MVKSFGQKSSSVENNYDRNDPGRFFGDGVIFKAKLIGILEVGEARGDRMCQEALQDLKMAIRAAGEHKQRITIHVTIDGLRLRDEKTGDSLYHHPVHKISFIAQDMTDSRAFGYIFGSPDSGHRFFGIKTDKAASQVVLAMRDLFQVVFELKKKEIEMARQQIQNKTIHEHQPITMNIKSSALESSSLSYNKSTIEASKSSAKEMSPESVADLVDLEQELSSIQRGITQMERITPNEPTVNVKGITEEDPFGDSFTTFPTYNLLPPPESSRSRHSKPIKPPDSIPDDPIPTFTTSQQTKSAVSVVSTISMAPSTDNWLENHEVVTSTQYDNGKSTTDTPTAVTKSMVTTSSSSTTTATTSRLSEDDTQKTGEDFNKTQIIKAGVVPHATTTQIQYVDAFTDLDPLGTGKSKPYIDKKYFFQELKNPPKKVLKDLSEQGGVFAATFSGGNDTMNTTDTYEKKPASSSTSTSDSYEATKSKNEFGYQQTNLERAKMEEPIMMPRDTDPFSPTRKKSDPFQEGDIFSKLDPFEFDFNNKHEILPDTKITSDDTIKTKKDGNIFNGPLQVSLPPESWSATMIQKKLERQASESPTSTSRNRPSVFKQNTVDVISSISSKKMPHLFGQKFSKRDSNSINMRRLQESDSLSENETAPEPPPRPDSASHAEPPPLPPKKQFSDIVIRPRITSSSAIPPPTRYDYVTAKMKANQSLDSAPPIPLPSRRVGRTETSFPGPGRPGRKPGEEDDYLTPITLRNDVPPLLPPPQTKGRGRRSDHAEHKTEPVIPIANNEMQPETIIPDITLTQLLTLGIDELATKLNVPTSKLSTMTLVELTTYLSDFIETSKKTTNTDNINNHNNKNNNKHKLQKSITEDTPIFKVNFDQNSDSTFVAKFDDNFGEEPMPTFIANFSNFDAKPEQTTTANITVPPADRYAVFREILEQEMHFDDDQTKSQSDEILSSIMNDKEFNIDNNGDIDEHMNDIETKMPKMPMTKIDTKITEAISHAKDRYAALRDIILVEDLFEKPNRSSEPDLMLDDSGDQDDDQDVFDEPETEKSHNDEESSPDNNQNFDDTMEKSPETRKTPEIKQNGTFMHTLTVCNKDDLEIDEFMNRAISNLSLDSRDHLSPIASKSPTTATTSIIAVENASTSPITPLNHINSKSQFNDMSTSPIPMQKSPAQKSPLSKSPLSKSPISKSPIQSPAITNLIDANKRPNSGSVSDVISGSSPEADNVIPDIQKTVTTPSGQTGMTESWATFDKNGIVTSQKSPKTIGKDVAESPCSSDGKDDWKAEQEYGRRWPKGHTSSSSRDLSPWDDEAPDYKKRPMPGTDRHGYYMRHARRMNSCDDDYEYEEDKRRERRMKPPISRSRENFDSDSQNWYHPGNHHSWSPPEDDDGRPRTFDRSSYERSTYGPPYEKRDHKIPYDRREYKTYDKRKYYREYTRPEYDFEPPYAESPDVKDRKLIYYGDNFEKGKCRRDYKNIYEDNFVRDGRTGHKSREYFYDRDRKSFDRDSVESYESTTRRHKSFGSGDVYGSLDSREDYRERYMAPEKTRSLRKSIKIRGTEEYEQDSENDVQIRRGGGAGDTRSLQRPPQSARIRKSSGSSPWDGEEPPPPPPPIPVPGQKGWKRPSSASESERRLAENRRVLSHTLSGSDGEKDRRFRKKPRCRGKDVENRPQTFGSMRYPTHRDTNYDYIDYDEYEQPIDEDKFERLTRRRQEMHQRMMEAERRKRTDKFTFDEDNNETLVNKYKKDGIYSHKFDAFEESKISKPPPPTRREFDFDDFEETPRSNTSSGKFNFEEHGFESDFNSSPPQPHQPQSLSSAKIISSNVGKSSFRFSNDFSEKEKPTTTTINSAATTNYDSEFNQTPTQKLRFDDNVTISKFDNDHHHQQQQQQQQQHGAFEDDFSKAEFVFENEDQWNQELPPPKKNSLRLTKRHENIKKSESVNIFARKSEDPFEDDDFFKATTSPDNERIKRNGNNNNNNNNHHHGDRSSGNNEQFQWDNNFAKFDENM